MPALPDPAHLALGHPGNDVWNHIWGYGWVARSVLAGELPVHTDLLAWPAGGSLWFIDTFTACVTLPVQLLAGPIAAYDAGIVGNLWLAGFGAAVLTRRETGSRAATWMAATFFPTTPHLLGQVYDGISETLSVGWLALSVWALREMIALPTTRRAFGAGLLFGICAVANAYYGVFSAIFAALLAPAARPWLARARAFWIAAAVAIVVAAGPFWLFARSVDAADALVSRDTTFVWRSLVEHNMTDALAVVVPIRSPDLKAAFGEDLLVVVYAGWAVLLPALYALRDWGRVRIWAVLAVVFGVLTLGPFLYVGGRYVVAGGWIPLPFLPLFQWMPLFSRISHAYRFAVPFSLCLVVLAGHGVAAAERRGWRVLWPLLAARMLESLVLFPVTATDATVPAIYRKLDAGAILELPVNRPVLARSRVLVAQLVHGQPLPFGLNDPVPPVFQHNPFAATLSRLEREVAVPGALPMLDLVAGQAALRELGARWVVLDRSAVQGGAASRLTTFLDAWCEPAEDDGVRRAWRL